MDLSIIIVNWNTRELLAACLESVFRTITQPAFDVWVIDNASSDDSVDMVRNKYPDVHIIANERNEGFGKANNQGISASSGEAVLLLNSDIVLTEGAVDTVWKRLTSQPRLGVLGCRLIGQDGAPQENVHMRFPHGPSLAPREALPDGMQEVSWLWAAFLMARRKVFDEVGLFDEDFLFFFEDTDWCWRARDTGWIIAYCPDVSVVHGSRQSAAKLPGDTFVRWLLIAEHVLYRKHHSPASYRSYAARRRLYYGFRASIHSVPCRLARWEWNRTRTEWFSKLRGFCELVRKADAGQIDKDALWGREGGAS